MENSIQMGIGFVTGRPNVCELINHYYQHMVEQLKHFSKPVQLTLFILFDLDYQHTKEEEFYRLDPEVRKAVKIHYITKQEIETEKHRILHQGILTKDQVNLFFGYGHAKGRNTLMYFAKKQKMDYLLFWDDDEYPMACVKEEGKLIWKKQDNIRRHIEQMEDTHISIGYHCGYISPIPYLPLEEEDKRNIFCQYIKAVSNEVVDWDSLYQLFHQNKGITYADTQIAGGEGTHEIIEKPKWVVGSTLCLNLRKIEDIPAFYNPPEARGEDAFFSLGLTNCVVTKTSVYHFHDGFLRYPHIMQEKYPISLSAIQSGEKKIEERFYRASAGWLKYKPLLLYVQNSSTYREKINIVKQQLTYSLASFSTIFRHQDFSPLSQILDQYDGQVEQHYQEYQETNQIWNKLKNNEEEDLKNKF